MAYDTGCNNLTTNPYQHQIITSTKAAVVRYTTSSTTTVDSSGPIMGWLSPQYVCSFGKIHAAQEICECYNTFTLSQSSQDLYRKIKTFINPTGPLSTREAQNPTNPVHEKKKEFVVPNMDIVGPSSPSEGSGESPWCYPGPSGPSEKIQEEVTANDCGFTKERLLQLQEKGWSLVLVSPELKEKLEKTENLKKATIEKDIEIYYE